MEINKQIMTILNEEMKLAEGCTEPIAIAYIAAIATKHLGKKPENMVLELSGNMIKNVDTVIVPNSGGNCGAEVAALLGAFYGDAEAELMVISNVTEENIKDLTENRMNKGMVEIKHAEDVPKLYIKVTATAGDDVVSCEIKHVHTNITNVTINGKAILDVPCNDGDFNSSLADRKILTVEKIYNFAKNAPICKELEEKLELVIEKNPAIAKEGLDKCYGINVGSVIMDNIEKGIYGKDGKNIAAAHAAAGSDARMNGSPMAVVSIAGSGNQGLTSTNSIISFAKFHGTDKETLYRSLLMSILTTIHIKTNVGRLSAYCGAVCAATGASAGFTFLLGGSLEEINNSIKITLGDQSGMLCDGAKNTCAKKIASAVSSAVDSTYISLAGNSTGVVGFIDEDIEKTISNIGVIASKGLENADNMILDIMISSNKG